MIGKKENLVMSPDAKYLQICNFVNNEHHFVRSTTLRTFWGFFLKKKQLFKTTKFYFIFLVIKSDLFLWKPLGQFVKLEKYAGSRLKRAEIRGTHFSPSCSACQRRRRFGCWRHTISRRPLPVRSWRHVTPRAQMSGGANVVREQWQWHRLLMQSNSKAFVKKGG